MIVTNVPGPPHVLHLLGAELLAIHPMVPIGNQLTVSIGVASSAKEKSDPEEVLQAADKALYRAKGNGRNRVETASSARRRTPVKAAGIA